MLLAPTRPCRIDEARLPSESTFHLLFCLIAVLHIRLALTGAALLPSALFHLPTCNHSLSPEADLSSATCSICGNITLQSPGTSLLWPSRVALLGAGSVCDGAIAAAPGSTRRSGSCSDGDSSLDLSSLVDILAVPPNGSVGLCGLRLEGAALPAWPYPLPASSFLALSAFKFTPPQPKSNKINSATGRPPGSSDGSSNASTSYRSPPPPSPQPQLPPPLPPLVLTDLLISTPNCTAFSLHQAFACAASPSPNFTVTPTTLIVHRYTTPTASITNVTLICSGSKQLPAPCTALRAATGAELLAAISALEGYAQPSAGQPVRLRAMDSYVFLSSHIRLAPSSGSTTDTSPGAGATSPAPRPSPSPSPTPSTAPSAADMGSSRPAVAANGQLPPFPPPPQLQPQPQQQLATIALRSVSLVIAGAPDGATELDLAGTAGLISVTDPATVRLRNLTLRNPPLGLASSYPWGLFRLGVWTFVFPRRLLGRPVGEPAALLLRDVAVRDVPAEELAAYWMDLVGEQAGALSLWPAPPSLAPCLCVQTQTLFHGRARWVEAELPYLETDPEDPVDTPGGSLALAGVRVYAATTAAAANDAAGAAGPLPPRQPIPGSGASSCLRGVLCQMVPEGTGGLQWPWKLRAVAAGSDPVELGSATPELWRLNYSSPLSLALRQPYNQLHVDPQRSLVIPIAVVGDPQAVATAGAEAEAGSVLDMGSAAPAVCLRGPQASVTLRHMVLIGLPPAGDAECAPLPPPPAPSTLPPAPQQPLLPLPPQPAQLPATPPPHQAQWRRRRLLLGTPRQGLDSALANLTSCVWSLGFDRAAAVAASGGDALPGNTSQSASQDGGAGASTSIGSNQQQQQGTDSSNLRPLGLPYVFLDGVTLAVPQDELDLFVWTWAHNSTAAATEPGLADHLGRMLEGSRLSAVSEVAVLAVLGAATAEADTGDSSSSGGGSAPPPPPPPPAPALTGLTFQWLWWCGLQGRDVTLTSRLPAALLDVLPPAAAAVASGPSAPQPLTLPVAYPHPMRSQHQPPPPQTLPTTATTAAAPGPPGPTMSQDPPPGAGPTLAAFSTPPVPRPSSADAGASISTPGGRRSYPPAWAVSLLAFGATCSLALLVGAGLVVAQRRRRGSGLPGVAGDGGGRGREGDSVPDNATPAAVGAAPPAVAVAVATAATDADVAAAGLAAAGLANPVTLNSGSSSSSSRGRMIGGSSGSHTRADGGQQSPSRGVGPTAPGLRANSANPAAGCPHRTSAPVERITGTALRRDPPVAVGVASAATDTHLPIPLAAIASPPAAMALAAEPGCCLATATVSSLGAASEEDSPASFDFESLEERRAAASAGPLAGSELQRWPQPHGSV